MKIEEKQLISNNRDIVLKLFTQSQEAKFSRIIVLAPAMATKQVFYTKLASYLVENGYTVVSLDYFGVGLSRKSSLRGTKITIDDWVKNVEDTIDFAESLKEDSNSKLYYLCHSLGGQILGLVNNSQKICAAAMYTSQNGYWRYYFKRKRYFLFWYLLVPPLVFLFRYFPFKLLGGGEDIPNDIMISWKKWCTSKDYFFDDPKVTTTKNFVNYTGPIRTHSFSDDGWATKPAVNSLVSHFQNAQVEHLHITPSDYNLESIRHFGFFREKSKPLWLELLEWYNLH